MDALYKFLTDMLGPMGPLIAVGFLGVVMILLTLPLFLTKQEDPLDKLKKSNKAQKSSQDVKEKLRAKQRNDKLEKYATFLEPQSEEELAGIKLKLMQAGYRDRDAVRYYHFSQFALGIGFLIVGGDLFHPCQIGHRCHDAADVDVYSRPRCCGLHAPEILGQQTPGFTSGRNHQRLS